MLKSKTTYVIAAAACYLYWLVHVPMPQECDYPAALRVVYSVVEGLKIAAGINFIFGGRFAGPFSIQDLRRPENTSGLTITYDNFAGVEVAIYKPSGFVETASASAMIFLHGGGFTIGSINSYAVQTSTLAKKTGMLIVVPEYRLAPEHPFPAAFDDCLAVTKEFLKRVKSYGVKPNKVILAGDSAGGNLAAAVALALGQETSPNPICMINLIYPSLQMVNFRLPSYLQNPNGPLLDTWFVTRFILNYIGLGNNTELAPLLLQNAHMAGFDREILERAGEKWVPKKYKKRKYPETFEIIPGEGYETLKANLPKIQSIATDQRMSSLLADDATLSLLPRTHIVTCEYDPLRDDGVILHERMQRLGLKSSFKNWEFCAHGIFNSYGLTKYEKLDSAVQDMLQIIKKALEKC